MGGNLPWALVLTGVFMAIVIEILGLPVLPVAIGIYLPVHLNAAIMCGGLVRHFIEKRKYASEKVKTEAVQSGILYTSGLIAGEGIVGIILAVLAIIPAGVNAAGEALNVGNRIDISGMISLGNIGGLVFFAALLASIFYVANKATKNASKDAE